MTDKATPTIAAVLSLDPEIVSGLPSKGSKVLMRLLDSQREDPAFGGSQEAASIHKIEIWDEVVHASAYNEQSRSLVYLE